MKFFLFWMLAFFTTLTLSGFTGENSCATEPPFEKFYVSPRQLVTFHDGIYYFDDNGYYTKVKTVLADCNGTYILIVNYQCPVCGRCWADNKPDDGYDCPIFQRKVAPGIWSEY